MWNCQNWLQLQVTLPSETSTGTSFLELYIQNILAFQNASCNGQSLLSQKSFFNILGTFFFYFMVLDNQVHV